MATKASPFQTAGRDVGVEIWRVERLTPVRIEGQDRGLFFTGDSYVILNTRGDESGKAYDVHFWLGAETSQDEAGAAAIFATELDDAVGGKAKQYRQVQGAESAEFLKLFQGGLQYREGGVRSGFKHVDKDHPPPPALLRVKGTKHVRVTEVAMDVGSLNSGDIFVLDLYNKLSLWSGAGASVSEKSRARELVEAMKASRKCQPEVVVIEEGERDDSAAGFYATLGAENPLDVEIKPATAAEEKPDADESAFSAPRLYKISDAEADVSVEELKEEPFRRTLLRPDSAYVLAADGWLFVWQGSEASSTEQKASLSVAHQLLEQLKLPHNTPVQLVKEGAEEKSFKQYFEWIAPVTPDVSANGKATHSAEESPSSSADLTVPPSPSAGAESIAAAPAAPSEAPKPEVSAQPTPASKQKPQVLAERAEPPPDSSSSILADSASEPSAPAPTAAKTAEAESPHKEAPKPSGGQQKSIPDAKQAAKPSTPVVAISQSQENQEEEESLAKPSEAAKKIFEASAEFVPKPQIAEPALPPRPAEDLKFIPGKDTFPYDELKEMRAESGVDMTRKEEYLGAEDFKKVFGKTVAEFKALPKWRQQRAKKEVGLF